jgi:hypothetical protein
MRIEPVSYSLKDFHKCGFYGECGNGEAPISDIVDDYVYLFRPGQNDVLGNYSTTRTYRMGRYSPDTNQVKIVSSDFLGNSYYGDSTADAAWTAIGDSDWTVTFWINAKQQGNFARIFATSSAAPSGLHILLQNNGTLGIEWSGGLLNLSTGIVDDGTWHYVTITRESGVVTSYIDNIQDSQFNILTMPITGNGFKIASDDLGLRNCDCRIDDFRVYDRAISEADRTTIYEAANGFILPTEQVSYALYLDARRQDTLSTAGSQVSGWDDIVSSPLSGKNYSQATIVKRPLLQDDDTVRFDGADDNMKNTYSPEGDMVFQFIFKNNRSSIGAGVIDTVFAGTTSGGNIAGANLLGSNGFNTTPNRLFFEPQGDQQPTSVKVRLNGVETEALVSSNTYSLGEYNIATYICEGIKTPAAQVSAIGSFTDDIFYASIDLGKFIMFPLITIGDIIPKTEGWLAWEYGAQESLDPSHPYYNNPPDKYVGIL